MLSRPVPKTGRFISSVSVAVTADWLHSEYDNKAELSSLPSSRLQPVKENLFLASIENRLQSVEFCAGTSFSLFFFFFLNV